MKFIVICLALLGCLALITFNSEQFYFSYGKQTALSNQVLTSKQATPIKKNIGSQSSDIKTAMKPSQHQQSGIQALIQNGQFKAAINQLNTLYQELTVGELNQFKNIILTAANGLSHDKNYDAASALLKEYTNSYDELDAWNILAKVASLNKQWESAVNALLKSSALEYRPDELDITLKSIIRAASHQRVVLQKYGDEIGVRDMYQRLYDQHPNYARFQLELAQAHLVLDDRDAAKILLEQLQYDPQLGDIAKIDLDKILKFEENEAKKDKENLPVEPNIRRGEIVVSLHRSGNSFLVDLSINSRPQRMLLDTGASITALSINAIKRLKLEPTGQSIKLNTANGIRSAKLYRADKVRLGNKLIVKNLIVAEIEFEPNSPIQGLLGTDLLNQFNSRYSYLIDNQQNALIFRRK